MEIIYPDNFFKVLEEGTDENDIGEIEIMPSYNYGNQNPNEYRDRPVPLSNTNNILYGPNMLPPNNVPNFGNPPKGLGAPPDHIPSKNSSNVKSMNYSNDFSSNQKHGPGGNHNNMPPIHMCLRKYTYIWQQNGRSYWAYLLSADRYQVTGWRWINWRWVYFSLDTRRIESFYC